MENINVNRNQVLNQLQKLVEISFNKKLSYMPDSFNIEQQNALKMFKQRIFLEGVIDNSLSFNRTLNWENPNKNLQLTTTAEDLVNVFKLRSDVYQSINYQDEFPDTIEGLNFDNHDKNSAIIYYKSNNVISGTIKVIYDAGIKLPSEEKYSFDYLRDKYKQLVELSRFVVANNKPGLNQEFKYLFAGVHSLFMNNDIDLVLSSIRQDHYKMYTKFGGTKIEKELTGYGKLDVPFLVLSWNPAEASNFFKKVFLNNKKI